MLSKCYVIHYNIPCQEEIASDLRVYVADAGHAVVDEESTGEYRWKGEGRRRRRRGGGRVRRRGRRAEESLDGRTEAGADVSCVDVAVDDAELVEIAEGIECACENRSETCLISVREMDLVRRRVCLVLLLVCEDRVCVEVGVEIHAEVVGEEGAGVERDAIGDGGDIEICKLGFGDICSKDMLIKLNPVHGEGSCRESENSFADEVMAVLWVVTLECAELGRLTGDDVWIRRGAS